MTTIDPAAFYQSSNNTNTLQTVDASAADSITSVGAADGSVNGSSFKEAPNVTIYVNNSTVANQFTRGTTYSATGILAITNGGTFSEDTQFPSGTLATPEKAGYTFDGWYSSADFTGDAVTTTTRSSTYYAKWTQVGLTLDAPTFFEK